MYRRFRTLVALLSIALQAIDALVGAVGHSHADEATHCAVSSECHHGDTCSQAHDGSLARGAEDESQEGQPGSSDHDDCALCRHFSQPVVCVAFSLEAAGSEQVEPFIPHHVECVLVAVHTTHAARGPPSFSA